MDVIITILMPTILSGVFATFITLWWQNKSRAKQEKTRIFTILMAKRYDITDEDCVEALNMIDIVFYKDNNVRNAWRDFKTATDMPDSDSRSQTILDKHLKLLEVMAESIGYKSIKWDDIKQYYYPIGLSDKKHDEAFLRRVQIDTGLAQIQNQEHIKSSQVDPQTDINNQMLIKVLENPDGLLKLFEAAEKAQKFNEGKKTQK